MLAAILTRDGFQLVDQPVPTPGPGQIRIRTVACGICEGDVYHYRMRGSLDHESLLGHEGIGVVDALGPDAQGFAVGDLVASLGGTYSAYYLTTPGACLPVPAGLDPTLALGEPVACCVHAAGRFGVRPGDRVAVVGCGFMGLICMQLARRQGAEHVCALEPIPWRREMARTLGADVTVDPQGVEGQQVAADLGEYDVVIEATGVPDALDLCGDLVKQHGRLIIVGYHQTQGGQRTVNMQQWNFKAIDIVNGHVRRHDEKMEAMRLGLDLLASGELTIAPLVTPYDLSQVAQAFHDLETRKPGLYKATLTMQA
jgi:threonine dehydrogenase-like Zn-dependent dehydrogenase